MALTLGVNSFVSLEEFDTYVADRVDMAASTDADDTTRSQALVSATDLLNELPWTGAMIDSDQPLAFPRNGSYFDTKVGGLVLLNGIPKRIKQATYELAHHILNNEGLQDRTGSVINMQVGSVNLSKIEIAPVIPLKVMNMIRPMFINRGARSWWRAN
jgi:hypothetical protein